jgi:hypothetical protein
MTVNGRTANSAPDWVSGPAHMEFGPLIPWAGGECPLPHDKVVRCLFRGREPYIGEAIWPLMPEKFKEMMWQHAPYKARTDPQQDIVAYQVKNG